MKKNLEVVYSLLIIIAVPAILVANTVYLASNARGDYVTELRRKADTLNQSVATAAAQYLSDDDTDSIQSYINQLTAEAPSISDIYIAVIDDGQFNIIASAEDNLQLQTYQTQHLNFTVNTDQPIARKAEVLDNSGNKTGAWEVATPIKDSNNQTIAVAVSTVSTADADELINETYLKSYIFLAISILIIIVLLVHHFKIAGYSRLLAKQKEVNQAMSDFLSVATHELKAPTSIIKGYISNVTDGTFGEISKDVKAQLYVALNQTDRLNALVQDLLNVSRVEQGRIEYNIEAIEVDEIISTIVENYKTKAQEKDLKLVYERSNTPQVSADKGRAQEIFTNLIDNAIKYTPSGEVSITTQTDKKYLLVKIRDSGVGISAEHRKRLFQRFYRVQTEETKDISGTGLGLWIIKQYIESMGGKIEVDSLIGSGTEFTVYLKLSDLN